MRTGYFILFVIFLGLISCSQKLSKDSSKIVVQDTIQYKVGDTIFPFKNYDFTAGNWQAKLYIHKDDRKGLPNACIKKFESSTKDTSVLNMLKDCNFIYTGSDVATIQSGLTLYENGKIIVEYEIVLENNLVGLQSRTYGWIKATDSFKICQALMQFK